GVAYYFMNKEDLEMLNVPAECGKDCLHLFSHLNNVKIWMSVTWDEEKNCHRVSVRSDHVIINKVAEKWHGGGHPFASGAKLFLAKGEKLEDLVKDLNDLIK
ncbi:MAG: bifunctional oligoribonuclease/PAP phosphatase NrnA, partial [Bacilli bacterium]|nr:bifunctional oligoribonuclease/PAP phosphatase NrnA [Bacilli bacterium]